MIVLPADPASACSCYPPTDASRELAEAEGAFVGRLVSRHEIPLTPDEVTVGGIRHNHFVYRFLVDEAVKGTFPSEVDVRSGEGGGDCGMNPELGEPVGLLVDRWQDQWSSWLCSQLEPDRLRKAAAPVPEPDGRPPVRLLVGTTYGGGRVLSLDAHGRIVTFGTGQGETTLIAVCPGSERMVEVFRHPEPAAPTPVLAVRRIDGLAVEREVELSGLGPSDGTYREVEALACRDAAVRDVVLFVREGSPTYRGRIIHFRGADRTTLWEGTATHGAFDAGGRFAYVTAGEHGTNLLEVDLAAQAVAERRVATLPRDPGPVAVDPAGRLAMLAGGHLSTPSTDRLLVAVEGSTGVVRTAPLPGENASGQTVWAPGRRVVYVPEHPREPVRVFDRNLSEVATWRGWQSSRAVIFDGRLLGLTQGLVQIAPPDGGPPVPFTDLGDGLPGAIAVVPGGDTTPRTYPAPDRSRGQASGPTIVAMLAVLTAGAGVAVRANRRGPNRTAR